MTEKELKTRADKLCEMMLIALQGEPVIAGSMATTGVIIKLLDMLPMEDATILFESIKYSLSLYLKDREKQ